MALATLPTLATAVALLAATLVAPSASAVPLPATVVTTKAKPSTIRATATKTTLVKGKAFKVKAKIVKQGKLLRSGKARVEERRAGVWHRVARIAIKRGRGSVKIQPTRTRTYRVVRGTLVSAKLKVTVTKPVNAPPPLTQTPPVQKPDPDDDNLGPLPTTAPTTFTATGSGFGHGVGMSQYGAYQLARTGSTAKQILEHYYSGVAVANVTMPTSLAVQVFGPEPYSFSGYADAATTSRFSVSAGKWRLRNASKKTVYPRTGAGDVRSAAVKVTLSTSARGVTATIVGGAADGLTFTDTTLQLQWSGTDEFKPTGTAAVASLTGAGGSYRHGHLTASSIGGRLNIVNELSMTDYLYGIAEMPSSWGRNGGAAALQAQAITARTYAYVRARVTTANPQGTKKAACACHLVDDVRDQMYTGWKKENETSGGIGYGAVWKAAVDATVQSNPTTPALSTSAVVTYAGKPISTYYYSSSGGRSANSEDVWVAKVPYLRSVADPESLTAPGNSMKSWTRSISQARLAGMFHLSNVARVQVTARYRSGQIKTLTATSTGGATSSVTQKAAVWSSMLGSLPSSWISTIR